MWKRTAKVQHKEKKYKYICYLYVLLRQIHTIIRVNVAYGRNNTMNVAPFFISFLVYVVVNVSANSNTKNQNMKKYKTITNRLTTSFDTCGLGIRTSSSSNVISLSDIFADYEWYNVNKNSGQRPLVAAMHGTSKTFQTFQSALSYGYHNEESHKFTINICEYVNDLSSGKSQSALQDRLMGYSKNIKSNERIIIYATNFGKCVTKSTLVLLNVFLDPWNGERAFLTTRYGETKMSTNIIWILEFKEEDLVRYNHKISSSKDFRELLENIWTSDDTGNQQITGEAYVGRLSHIVSIDDIASTKKLDECNKLITTTSNLFSGSSNVKSGNTNSSLVMWIVIGMFLLFVGVYFSNNGTSKRKSNSKRVPLSPNNKKKKSASTIKNSLVHKEKIRKRAKSTGKR